MKTLQIAFLLIFQLACFGQTPEYGGWQTVYQETVGENSLKVEISFKLSTCGSYGLKSNSRWRTRNKISKNATLTFKFDWVNCDNQTHTENMSVDLNKQGIDDYVGNWFLGKTISKQPYDIKINGTAADQYNLAKRENQKVNSVEYPLLIEEVPSQSDAEKAKHNEDLKKHFGKMRVQIKPESDLDKTKRKLDSLRRKSDVNSDTHLQFQMGTRGDNATPNIQVESEAITVEQAPQTTTKKK